jgi:hypothetical protein
MTWALKISLTAGAAGCLISLLLWSAEAKAQGTEESLPCGPGRVLVGIRGRQGLWMDGIQGRCRTINANGTLSTTVTSTPYRGGNGGTVRTFECRRPTEVMVGYSGSLGSNGYVRYVHEVICAPWQPATRTAGTPTTTVSAFEKTPGSGKWIADSCFQGKIGTRLRVRAGQYLDRLLDMGCSYAAGATPPTAPATQPPPPPPQITAAPSPIGPSGTYNTALCPLPENPLFSWGPVAGATSYIVEYVNSTRNQTMTRTVSSTSTRPPAMFLEGNLYSWRVRGSNATGQGPWSGYMTFTGVAGTSTGPCVTGRTQYF